MRYLLDTNVMIDLLNDDEEHYKTFVNMEWNWAEKHTDTTDILIVAHAITEKTPLISSDGKLDYYKKQGLNLIFNKRRQINDKR